MRRLPPPVMRMPQHYARTPTNWQVLRTFRWLQPGTLATLGIAIAALVYALLGLPWAFAAIAIAVLASLKLFFWALGSVRMIDERISAVMGNLSHWPVHTKSYALYKFADIHRAAEAVAAKLGSPIQINSAHGMPLEMILGGMRNPGRQISSPMLVPRKVGPDEEAFFPGDSFWLVRPYIGTSRGCVIRVRLPFRSTLAVLEVAAPTTEDAAHILDLIGEHASSNSIYRGHMIRVVFSSEVRSDYDEDESVDGMDLLFYRSQPINADDIILDDSQSEIVSRTIIDFHRRRDQLAAFGLPRKRGVLFYGPPGTGKTYTCKYIAGQLEQVTTVIATGHALLNMKAVCAVARSLQPALVLLEDVDLVFANRDINAYNTVLGEFIDQLDGFGDTDEIIFILTTNAIDRIEAAIKDRPGRVSQCIYFGPPGAPLRRRYMEALLRPYNINELNLERAVSQTDGVSQAFLKELIFRSVQIASARLNGNGHMPLDLTDDDLATALRDMTAGSGRAAQRIIGFRVDTSG